MVVKMQGAQRCVTLLVFFMKYDLSLEFAYGWNFLFATAGKIFRVFLLMVFFQAIAAAVPSVSVWNEPQLYVLAATFYTTDLIASIFFHRNLLFHLPKAIREGSFDGVVTKPISPLFYTAFSRIDVGDLFSCIPLVYFWYYLTTHFSLPFSFASVALYIGFVFNAIVFIFALVLLLGSLSFWTIRGDGFGRFIDHVTGAARFPLDVFHEPIKTIVWYVFPLALLSTLPTQALFGLARVENGVYSILFTVFLLLVALLVWKKGIRHYDSASS